MKAAHLYTKEISGKKRERRGKKNGKGKRSERGSKGIIIVGDAEHNLSALTNEAQILEQKIIQQKNTF